MFGRMYKREMGSCKLLGVKMFEATVLAILGFHVTSSKFQNPESQDP